MNKNEECENDKLKEIVIMDKDSGYQEKVILLEASILKGDRIIYARKHSFACKDLKTMTKSPVSILDESIIFELVRMSTTTLLTDKVVENEIKNPSSIVGQEFFLVRDGYMLAKQFIATKIPKKDINGFTITEGFTIEELDLTKYILGEVVLDEDNKFKGYKPLNKMKLGSKYYE